MTDKEKKVNIIRVSVSEAARLLGIETKTIRRALQRQELRYIVVRGRYKIQLESLLRWSQTKSKIRQKLATKGIGQYVEQWKIKNTLFSPNPKNLKKPESADAAPSTDPEDAPENSPSQVVRNNK